MATTEYNNEMKMKRTAAASRITAGEKVHFSVMWKTMDYGVVVSCDETETLFTAKDKKAAVTSMKKEIAKDLGVEASSFSAGLSGWVDPIIG